MKGYPRAGDRGQDVPSVEAGAFRANPTATRRNRNGKSRTALRADRLAITAGMTSSSHVCEMLLLTFVRDSRAPVCAAPSPRSRLAAIRALMLRLLLAAALMPAGMNARAAEGDAAERLTIGDKVTVSIFGQPDLSGDFVLDGRGDVHVPLVGRVRIVGLTPPEAEQRIRSALAEGYLREAIVSVRAAELKPIYVLGEVRTPGSYPFRHGLRVIGAVALAGGYRVGDQALTLLRSDLLLADERVRQLEVTLQALTARRLRLEAERDGLNHLAPLPTPEGAGFAALLAGEREILEFQYRARVAERDLLQQQVARLDAERAALTEQARLIDHQVTLTRDQVADYSKLTAGGHGLRPILVEREREHARTQSDAAKNRADLSKNATAVGELALRIQEAEVGFKRRVVLELQDTRQKILDVERSIPVAREIYESRRRRLAADDASDWVIRVTRQEGANTTAITAKLETLLQPGDIVEIVPAAAAGAASPVTGGQGAGTPQTFAGSR